MSFHRLLPIAALVLSCGSAIAGPAVDALGQCLSDNTSGKDRKNLAKWIFVGMAAHPEIQASARIDPATVESAQRAAGDLVTRLLGSACTRESQAAVKAEGLEGAKLAFEFLGKIAMQELMTNPSVNTTINGFERFVDRQAIDKAFKPQ